LTEWLQCVTCGTKFPIKEIRYTCDCGGLLSVERVAPAILPAAFDARRASRKTIDQSGVWRFREAVLDVDERDIVTHPEGSTRLYERGAIFFKHEGENPTASFKDRGMTVAVTQAKRLGARAVACASTGNTSASLAAYAAQAGLRAIVFVPSGKISGGKLAQTLAYGATCLQVRGDFDAAMRLVRQACDRLGIYLVNSINPFRIEGQKTIVWELLQDLEWHAPDWIVVPAGNLGNTSAFGKALVEAHRAGWIDRMPRLAAIQASGANPFFRSFGENFATRHRVTAETIASAIRIGDPRHERHRRRGDRQRADGRQTRHRPDGHRLRARIRDYAGRRPEARPYRPHRLRPHRPRPEGHGRRHEERGCRPDQRDRSDDRSGRARALAPPAAARSAPVPP
jgi:threonine synthase